MSYNIEVNAAARNGYHTPPQAQRYYGRYSRTGITVHWWNAPSAIKDSDHNKIVNYILSKARAGTGSVNYVLSNTKITMLVAPENVAWASQAGNATTISIEFSPHLNAEGYKKAGWLIWQLEKRFGKKLALYKHSKWTTTQCPGHLDLNRMRREANKWANGDYDPILPKPTPAKAKLRWSKLKTPKVYVTNKPSTKLWDFDSTSWNMKEVKSYEKGEKIKIYGKVVNQTLGATYLLTEYSYTRKVTNGFNQADLDEFKQPVIVEPPKKPEPVPIPKPISPKPDVPEKDSDYGERITALENIIRLITEFLDKIFLGWRNKKD